MIEPNELYHHGVKGMKWGVRKRYQSSGGIGGAIRNKQRSNAERDLSKINSRQKQVNSELRELRSYSKNPSKIGRSRVATAIRNKQIDSLKKTNDSLNQRKKDNKSALKELDQIDKYQAKKAADKAQKKLAKVKNKDLEKRYGQLEDQMTYGKKADAKANARIQKEMSSIDRQIDKLKKH